MSEPIRSHQDALNRLDDAQYFAWCLAEAQKVYLALIAKRFPQFAKPRTTR